jgi:hypothetical protein
MADEVLVGGIAAVRKVEDVKSPNARGEYDAIEEAKVGAVSTPALIIESSPMRRKISLLTEAAVEAIRCHRRLARRHRCNSKSP